MKKTLLVLIAALAAAPSTALARPDQVSVFMDGSEIVYGTDASVDQTLTTLKSLGVDSVRVTVYWRLIAPEPDSNTKPSFDASDPDAYPAANWVRYDRIVKAAQAKGLRAYFNLTAPAPFWATATPPRDDIKKTYLPNPQEFQAFATAVGKRYSGEYQPVTGTVQDPAPPKDIFGNQPAAPPPRTVRGEALPRVDLWSAWNEPNHPGWLTPSWVPDPRGGKGLVMSAGPQYRALVDAAYTGLTNTGHGGDTILIGETAPRGLSQRQFTRPIRPLEFIRAVYCLDDRYKSLTGSAATALGCPDTAAGRANFVTDHPGLFRASGWAHHPYALEQEPLDHDPDRQNATMADLPRLHQGLRRAFSRYGQKGPPPVWLTEYGYQTDPPDPTIGVSWKKQADYLAQAEHIAYDDKNVHSMAQFLLRDDGPLTEYQPSDPRYWGTFQSGLITSQGKPKTSYASYQAPVDVRPRKAKPGAALSIWGVNRPAGNADTLQVRVEFARRGSKRFRTIAGPNTVRGSNGNYETFVEAKRSGSYRLAWSGGRTTSAVAVRVKAPSRRRAR